MVLAELIRPRGVRGEILSVSQTDVPGRLERLENVSARLKDGSDVALTEVTGWPHKEFWVLKIAGIDTMDDAERFRGADLWIPLSERGALPDGEWFQSDLIGCSLVEAQTGRVVGLVEGLQRHGGPALLEVKVEGREVLVPFVPEICRRVDLEARKIIAELPDGLLDL